MKFLASILFLVLGFSSTAQVIVDSQYYNRSKSNYIWDRVKGDSVLAPPSIKATKGKFPGSFIYNSGIKGFEVYDSATARWYPVLSIQQDGLITGGVVSWTGTGLQFYVSSAVYMLGGVVYSSAATTVTLSAANVSNPRIDVIGLNTSGVVVIEGTPASSPAKPQVVPSEQLELTSVLVNAGATTPSSLSQYIIWDENTESTTSGTITINANNTANPFHLTKAIDASSHSSGTIVFTLPAGITLSDYSVFVMYIRLKATYPALTGINVQFSKPGVLGDNPVTTNVTITNGQYGYSRNIINQYQTIQIPISAFTFSTTPTGVNKLTLRWAGSGSGFYLDYIQLQSGVIVNTTGVNSFNTRTGNVTPLKADYAQYFLDTTYRRVDSVFGKKNGVEYFQFKDSTGGVGSGTVTSIATGLGLSGGAITTTGTIVLDTSSSVVLSRQRAANTYPTITTFLDSVNNRYSQILALADSTGFQLVKPNGLRDTVLFSADDLTIYTRQQDTISLASFGGGSGAAGDTTTFSTSAIYGSFYNSGSDTLIITSFQIGLQGTSPSITTEVFYNDSLNISAGATKLVNAGSAVTGIYGLTTVLSLDNTKIPPGNWVWVKTSAVTTKPTYFTLTLIGYKKRK